MAAGIGELPDVDGMFWVIFCEFCKMLTDGNVDDEGSFMSFCSLSWGVARCTQALSGGIEYLMFNI